MGTTRAGTGDNVGVSPRGQSGLRENNLLACRGRRGVVAPHAQIHVCKHTHTQADRLRVRPHQQRTCPWRWCRC